MLQITNLTITHTYDLRVILKDFSFTCNYGDKVAIIGEEGNGKSTLLKWLYNPNLIESYMEYECKGLTNNEKMGYLPQELSEEDKKKTVYEFFSADESFLEATSKELNKMAVDVGVSNDFYYANQNMESLSGGEKIKAQLMRLLLGKPTLLLLDEPSNDIDIETLEFLEDLINNWEYMVIFISHDEVLMENTANTIIHLEQIKKKMECRYTIAHCDYEAYKERRDDAFQKQMQMAQADKRAKTLRDEKYRKIYAKVEYQLRTITRQDPHGGYLLKKKMHAVKSLGKRFEREDEEMVKAPEKEEAIYFTIGDESSLIPNGKVVLDYNLNALEAPDGRILAKGIRLYVQGPQKICIIGINGVGKTTLLKHIVDELSSRKDLKVEYMPQNYEEQLDLDITPAEYLSRSGDKEEYTKIRSTLGSLKFTSDEMNHAIRELSGGQKAKVFLLKMSMGKANVLILDEPTRNFSPLSGEVIRDMLASFPGCIISISHDRKYIVDVCSQVYKLSEHGLEEVYDDANE